MYFLAALADRARLSRFDDRRGLFHAHRDAPTRAPEWTLADDDA